MARKKLYAVRGINGENCCGPDEVGITHSPYLHANSCGCWLVHSLLDVADMCYEGWLEATGIELEPGEYVEVRFD